MIYIVEDETGIRDMMLYTLRSTGFEAAGYPEARAFFEAMQAAPAELVLLDIMLPGEDGLSILARLKASAAWRDIPVIMTTARGTEYDKIVGLEGGADDYLAKPFGMMEMVSRIRAVLRRAARTAPPAPLGTGALTLSDADHTVTVCGARTVLTLKEFALLRLFLTHPGRVFTRTELLSRVWNTDFGGETRTVDVHIRTLRAKLGLCGGYIETVRGVGYRLEAQPEGGVRP